jgi:sigma-B regulation protein RsbU (phosphoserine phosphatase)
MTYNLSGLVRDVRNQTVRGTELAMAYQVILSVICLLSLFCFVLRPLREVMRNIRIYRNTKQSRDIVENLGTINVNNEIGELSEDIIDLTEEIDEHMERIRNITAETERISAELSLATKIQAAMLPHIFPPFPDHEEFEIYASMDPAREVGGDFYDFFLPDDDHLCMVMADVSGKGVPAALLMMASKIILQSCAMLGNGAAEILTRTNEAVCSNNPEEMFITAWVGILELSTGRLTAANAGHEYPVIKEPDRQFEMIRDKHGFVLGAMENMVYEEYEMMLEPGTKLFLYTDGVTEASDSGNNMFGTDRMLQALNKDNEAAPEQLLRNVRGAVDEFIGGTEQFDDLTMLCITYNGKDE